MEQHVSKAAATSARRRAEIATKALLRAGLDRWKLSQRDLAAIIGLSESTMTRVVQGSRVLALASKEGELSLMVLRVYRALQSLVGDDEKARLWLVHENQHLRGVPLALMRRVDGIVRVAEYLDAMRGKV